MTHYKLRPGTSADADVVRRIFFAALSEHGFAPIAANLNPEIATFGAGAPAHVEIVATAGDEVVGFIILTEARDGGVAELSKVFVAHEHRQRGVGTLLISRVTEIAKQRGYGSLMLYTNDAFETARAYYEGHGWSRTSADDGTAIYTRPLVELSPLLRWLLSLLDRFARMRSRLEDELEASSSRVERRGVRAGAPSRTPVKSLRHEH